MGPDESRELERSAVRGDSEALRMLLLRFGPEIERGLEIHPKWRSVLEPGDVMQITYLEAFLHIDRFDAQRGEPFVHWLRRIAENNLRDAIRALGRQKQPQPERRVVAPQSAESMAALVELLGATNTTPSRGVVVAEAHERLSAALEALPEGYQTAVRMYDLEGRTIEEVAAALGKSPGAVHMMRARAHDRLRELLGTPSGVFPSEM
jgi:RNA polymerase sigma-70 factor (ECF subfamily)